MEFKDSYFEDEVREGFYVPSMIKRAWAAEMQVLHEVDRICKKYDIPYFADWGTLLGAVRHSGFIPWDDDIDISMKRADYNRFIKAARQEMPEGYEIYNYKENEDYWGFVTRVVAKRRICFEEEHLKKFHGFPYIAGIDIFLLDYVSADEEKEQQRVTVCNYIIAIADGIAEGSITGDKVAQGLKKIEEICGVQFDIHQDINQLRVQLYDLVVSLFAVFPEEESNELTRMMPNGLKGDKHLRLPKRYYDDMLWMQFENTSVPVPIAYDEMLTRRYGNYMKLVRNEGGHDYPFFETQKQQLENVMDFDIPHYTFSKECLKKESVSKKHTLKGIAEDYQKSSSEALNNIKGKVEKKDYQGAIDDLVSCQQFAIEFAGIIEKCKGEGHITVGYIEEYCEVVYQLYEAISNAVNFRNLLNELKEIVEKVNESINRDILQRKEAVFLPFKSDYWNAMESVWKAAMQDPECDVYVIPIPYYYKEYDGRFYNMQYEGRGFPDNIDVTRYDEYDFALHYPDMIVIQNPYDEWNASISVPSFFYSSNLRKYTEKLVYIPFFKLEEFNRDSYREYHNMQYYCTVPGVINSDKVIVQSENMRQLYIEKLVEFSDEDIRSVWEDKVIGLGTPIDDCQNHQIDDKDIPDEWKKVLYRNDGTRKKAVLFYVGASSIVQYQKEFIRKVKEVLGIFYENHHNIALIWITDEIIEQSEKYAEDKVWQDYRELVEDYKRAAWGVYVEKNYNHIAMNICDIYYGDSSRFVNEYIQKNKMIMIMNYTQ